VLFQDVYSLLICFLPNEEDYSHNVF
jgi:hypothetical protein